MKVSFSNIGWALIILASQFFLSSCEPPVVEKVGGEPVPEKSVEPKPRDSVKVSVPLERTITDNKGREIAVTITGKTFDKIQFNRKSDGKQYVLPISSLSVSDQQFLTTVADSSEEALTASDGLPPVLQIKLKYFEKQLADIIVKIEVLKQKKYSANLSLSSPRRRSMVRDMKLLEQEQSELEIEIANLKRKL